MSLLPAAPVAALLTLLRGLLTAFSWLSLRLLVLIARTPGVDTVLLVLLLLLLLVVVVVGVVLLLLSGWAPDAAAAAAAAAAATLVRREGRTPALLSLPAPAACFCFVDGRILLNPGRWKSLAKSGIRASCTVTDTPSVVCTHSSVVPDTPTEIQPSPAAARQQQQAIDAAGQHEATCYIFTNAVMKQDPP
jgi:hypothetical protein